VSEGVGGHAARRRRPGRSAGCDSARHGDVGSWRRRAGRGGAAPGAEPPGADGRERPIHIHHSRRSGAGAVARAARAVDRLQTGHETHHAERR